MSFEFGDVVMFMGKAYFVIDFDDDINLMTVTNGVETTSEIDYEDVVKIGHDDSLEQNILDRLKVVVDNHDNTLQNNQAQLIGRLKDVCLSSDGVDYYITGKTKVDGKYLYCQVDIGSDYEWILAEELINKLFK